VEEVFVVYTSIEVRELEIIKHINNAIDYIEANLDANINVDEIARIALSSRYHFQRMFHALTGFTVTEYIRNRRMTLAGEELVCTNIKIIDIANKYSYDSPDAFTKAFQRFHGSTPSMVRRENRKLKAFPKLSFKLSIKGECEMNYRIVKKDGFKVFGVETITTTENNALYKEIPEFCNKIWNDGTHEKINTFLGYPKNNMLYGIHYDFKENGNRRYMIGWETLNKDIPKEYKIVDVYESTWAIFEESNDSSNSLAIQDLWRRIYSEWFPSSGFEQVEGVCMEKYFWDDEECDRYTYEIWIPVKRK
jgi:AraC family transcriptional regulator